MDPVVAAADEVQLGASIADLHQAYLMRDLDVEREIELPRALNALTNEARRELRQRAVVFAGRVCRHLADHYRGDDRICNVLVEWVTASKDYDAFDALLSNFEFPARERLKAEGKRRFPATLTSHW